LCFSAGFFNQPQHGIRQRTGITRIDADKSSAHTRNQGQIMQNKWRVTLNGGFTLTGDLLVPGHGGDLSQQR
jgi:hypothetical protein